MILDIIVIVLMVIPAALGIYRGFFRSFVRTAGWIIAVVCGFFLKDTVAEYVAKSSFGEMIYQNIYEKFASSFDVVLMSVEGLPEIIRGGIAVSAKSSYEILAQMFSSMIISVVSFAGVVIVVWLLLKILIRPASKRKRGGILNTSDKMMGFFVGFMEGVLIVFVLLAGLMVYMNFADAALTEQILAILEESYIAGTLYDNNLLLLITGGLNGQ